MTLWEPKISAGCLLMVGFWATGLAMLFWGWIADDFHIENVAIGLIITAAVITVLRDNMRTRRQMSALARRASKEREDMGGNSGGGGGSVVPFSRQEFSIRPEDTFV